MWATAKIVPAKASTSKQNKTNTQMAPQTVPSFIFRKEKMFEKNTVYYFITGNLNVSLYS